MIDIRFQVLVILAVVIFGLVTFVNPTFAQEESSSPVVLPQFGFGADFPLGDFIGQFFGAKYNVSLDGSQEVLGGDVDGIGEAKIRIREHSRELCADIEADYIDQASAAHIHHAPIGSTGAVVVSLPILDGEGKAEECVEVNPDLLKKINANPQDYYINIHTNPYPDGAIRGQLSK